MGSSKKYLKVTEVEKCKIKEIIIDLRGEILNGDIRFPGGENFPLGCHGNASDILLNRIDQFEITEHLDFVIEEKTSQFHKQFELI